MDTIRTYLDNLFKNLPQTDDVLKAKAELLANMEDKYNELMASGKTENEAIGIVISEFGNIDELLEELGLSRDGNNENQPEGRHLSLADVKNYIGVRTKGSYGIGLGVLLCICAPIALILLEGFAIGGELGEAIGVSILLVQIAIAVGLFVINGMNLGRYDYMESDILYLDTDAEMYTNNESEKYRNINTSKIVVGIVMCIVAINPLIVVDDIFPNNDALESVMTSLLLFLISIAVFLFINAGMSSSTYKILLQQEDYRKEVKQNKLLKVVSSIYWLVITAVYLVYSFTTFEWYRSWIIWPIAGIVYGIIATIFNAIDEARK